THISKLLRLTDEIVFCFDGDAAGRKAAWRALDVCLPLVTDSKPVRFLFLPPEHDPDTYIRERGKEDVAKRAKSASGLSEFLLGELRGQFDIALPEGRSAFFAAAKPYIQKIAAPLLKLQILKECARLAEMTPDEALHQVQGDASPAPAYRRPAPARPRF